MEAPPPLSTPPTTTPTTPKPPPPFLETLNFSPLTAPPPPPPPKLRLMCSYGGHIIPRPHDKTLCYVGGDTRIIVIDRHSSLSDLHRRLSKNLFNNQPFSLKYQLPSEDLDSLITLTSDEDLENMVDEYDRLNNAGAGTKPGRLRLFLFPKSPSIIEQLLVESASTKSEDWFFNALNGKTGAAVSDRGFSETSSLNCLLGLEDEFAGKAAVGVEKDVEAQIEASKSIANGNLNVNYGINHDVQSIPGSPMLETTSSFGSTSSSPSLVNLPPIRVHVEENPKLSSGIEEQFQQMSVGNSNPPPPPPQKQEDVGVYMPATVVVGGGEYANRVVSDDERPDHSGHGKAQQIQFQHQQIPQFQQKQANNFDPASPNSASSDGSALSRQRQAVYQEPLIQIQSGNTRISSNQADHKNLDQSNNKVQMQPQFQESGYQYDQNQPQFHQPQQFLHPGNQYPPSSAVSYYSVYPPQQQHHPHQSVVDQHYPFYFIHPNAPSSNSQMPPPATLVPQTAYNQTRNAPSSKAEMGNAVYRTTTPQLVQMPSTQPQYVGFPQIHHASSAPNSTFAYEFADPTHAQMYYTPLPPQLAAQYQTLTSGMDTFSQPPAENVKQQGRNSQA